MMSIAGAQAGLQMEGLLLPQVPPHLGEAEGDGGTGALDINLWGPYLVHQITVNKYTQWL